MTFSDDVALATAYRSRALHGVSLEGHCLHCPGEVPWPCSYWERAQHTVTIRDPQTEVPASVVFAPTTYPYP